MDELTDIVLNVPINLNLDAMNPDDLDTVADVFSNMGSYARLKSTAMRLRLNGDISEARKLEKWCEKLYQQLPEWARW